MEWEQFLTEHGEEVILMNEIFHRVSIRKYEDRLVEKEKIRQILRAGMQAPSAGNQQPWMFYVVTNREKIQALSKSHQYAGCAAGAPVLIVPVYRTEGLWVSGICTDRHVHSPGEHVA